MKSIRTIILAVCFFQIAIPVWSQQKPEYLNQNIATDIFQQEVVSKMHDGVFIINKQSDICVTQRGNSSGSGNLSPTAVPVNNDCANATSLTVNAPCVNGTNKEANTQTGESTACQGVLTKTVWYKFTATATTMYVEVERTASSGCFLSSSVYSGSCQPSTSIACEDAAGGPNLNIHNLTGLTINSTYLIQVSYIAGGPCGNNNNTNTGADFCIRVGTPQVCNTCNNPCGPICIFPSAPTVAQVTSTCTAYDLKARINAGQTKTQCYTFTAVATSFSLQMIINSVGCGMSGNVSTFNWQLYPSNCSAAVQSGNLTNLNATGLTIGAAYVLCYTWTATCQHNTVYPYMVATSPLPVELLNFEGKQAAKKIALKWTTSSEIDNDYFMVEKSADGKEFESLGKVKGAGNSTQVHDYTLTDKQPFQGVNYYRLKQSDYNGSVEYSDIIAVKFIENISIKIENNPVKEDLQVIMQNGNNSTIKFEIINRLGEKIFETSRPAVKGYNKFNILVEHIPAGMYFLKIESQSGTTWTRFMKL